MDQVASSIKCFDVARVVVAQLLEIRDDKHKHVHYDYYLSSIFDKLLTYNFFGNSLKPHISSADAATSFSTVAKASNTANPCLLFFISTLSLS